MLIVCLSLASLGNSFFSYTLQYGYNVNTTVLNKFTVSAQSKTQCYKASGYLSIDLFMRHKN